MCGSSESGLLGDRQGREEVVKEWPSDWGSQVLEERQVSGRKRPSLGHLDKL